MLKLYQLIFRFVFSDLLKEKYVFLKFVCFNLCYKMNSIQLCVHGNLGYFGVSKTCFYN